MNKSIRISKNILSQLNSPLSILAILLAFLELTNPAFAYTRDDCGKTIECGNWFKSATWFQWSRAKNSELQPLDSIQPTPIAMGGMREGTLSYEQALNNDYNDAINYLTRFPLADHYCMLGNAEFTNSVVANNYQGIPTFVRHNYDIPYISKIFHTDGSYTCSTNTSRFNIAVIEFASVSCPSEMSVEFLSEYGLMCTKRLCHGLIGSKSPDRPTSNIARWFQEGQCPIEEKQTESCSATGTQKDNKSNPIACRTGEKFQTEVDYQSPSNSHLKFSRHYSSQSVFTVDSGSPSPQWSVDSEVEFNMVHQAPYGMIAELKFGDGGRLLFIASSNTATTLNAATPAHGTLKKINGAWEWTKVNGHKFTFGADGKVTKKVARGGQTTFYEWTDIGNGDIRMTAMSDQYGKTLRFTYGANGQLLSMTTPEGQTYRYEYDVIGNIASVIYPDDTPYDVTDNPRKRYAYEDARFPKHLTGIIDENGHRYATWAYDAQGRGILSEHANSADKTTFEYLGNGETIVQYHLNESTYREQLRVIDQANGADQLKREEDFPCVGCGVGSIVNEYNTRGWLVKTTDKNGAITTYVRDSAGRETSRTEGFGTPQAKTVATSWNTTWNQPAQITDGNYRQNFSYNAAGLLTQKTDTEISPSKSLITKYTYNTANQLTRIDGPRTDASDITNYAYDALGNLTSVTNALGHVTTLSNYDANGRVGQITDANGLVTTLSYTPRGWLKTRTVGTLTTSFDYDRVGQLIKVTMPDGSFVVYEYDGAHRLTAIQNALGERMEYTLDYAGNRVKEEVKDAQGLVVQKRSSEFNAMNQLVRSLNAANQITASYQYDANGNMTSVSRFTETETSSSSYEFDPLNRLNKITDALNGITEFTYDNLDQLTAVKDPKGLQTQYGVSALGELKQTTSPDTAQSSQTFDSAGNVKTSTNARGHTTTYTYDVLNRVTQMKYHDLSTVNFSYDSTASGNFGKGRLTGITDASGSTAYTYDPYGRLTEKTATVNGVNLVSSYRYDNYGRLEGITYPSGRELSFSYQNGQLQQLNVDGSARLKNIAYQPFSAVKNWQWGDNSSYTRSFNLDGQLQSYPLGPDTVSLSYDRAGRITTQTHAQTQSRNQNYYYDLLDRVTGASGAYALSFSYDANGNRLSKQENSAFDHYTVSTNSNRVDAITGALNRSYQYDAAGNTTSDGERVFTYNSANRLTSAQKGSVIQDNLYNGLGQRVRKTVNGAHTLYAYDEAGHLIGEYNADGSVKMEVVYLGDQPVLAMNASGVFYIHADHLNTPRAIVGANQSVIWRWDSSAFGDTAALEDPDGNGIAFNFNHRFPGQVYDADIGLHYNYFRNYDPVTGRYIESDPIGLAGGINTYGYVGGNPISFIDPDGLNPAVVLPLTTPPIYPGPGPMSPNPGRQRADDGAPYSSPGYSTPNIGNPFSWMLGNPKPRWVTGKLEGYWDKAQCSEGDVCQQLKAYTNNEIRLAYDKHSKMLNDKVLFRHAYDVANFAATGTNTTWIGHVDDIRNRIGKINALISMGQRLGCDMSSEVLASSGLYVPNSPLVP